MNNFLYNLIYYLNKYQRIGQYMCNDLNIKYTTLTGWVTDGVYPRLEKIGKEVELRGECKIRSTRDESRRYKKNAN